MASFVEHEAACFDRTLESHQFTNDIAAPFAFHFANPILNGDTLPFRVSCSFR
jgi:hypothetical protein